MSKLAIYGASAPDVLKLVKAINQVSDKWQEIVFVDDIKYPNTPAFYGYPIIGNRESIGKLNQQGYHFINNVASSIEAMRKVNGILTKAEVKFANLIAPDVLLFNVKIGKGIMIYSNNYIGCNVTIGDFCMIRANCTLNHDSIIGDHCFLSSGVHLGGKVSIEKECFVGIGANIRDNLVIRQKSIIGMGANVVKDVHGSTTVYGNPAKVIL